MNVFSFVQRYKYFHSVKDMTYTIQLGFASLNGIFNLSPHENICTIALINIHYLYTIDTVWEPIEWLERYTDEILKYWYHKKLYVSFRNGCVSLSLIWLSWFVWQTSENSRTDSFVTSCNQLKQKDNYQQVLFSSTVIKVQSAFQSLCCLVIHVVTVLWEDSDNVGTILSPTSGTSYPLQNLVSLFCATLVPILHSDFVLLGICLPMKWSLQLLTQQNSYSINHLLGTVTTQWLGGDGVVTIDNCRQHGDWAASGSVVTVMLAVVDSDVTVQSLCSHCA